MLPDGDGHEPDADRRAPGHDRLDPGYHRPQATGFKRDQVAFEEAPNGSVITSPEGRIERVNQAVCRMTREHGRRSSSAASSFRARPSRRPAREAPPRWRRCWTARPARGASRGRYLRSGGRRGRGERRRSPRSATTRQRVVAALHADRGRHRRAAHHARARAGAVRDARPPRLRRPSSTTTTPDGTRIASATCRSKIAERLGLPDPELELIQLAAAPARRRQDRDPRRGARQARQADRQGVRA